MEKLLCPEPLKDGADLPDQWKIFKRNFTLFLTAAEKDAADPKVKVALLLRTIGSRGLDIYDSFTWAEDDDKDDLDKVFAQFDEYCAPRINTVAMTHKLLTSKQGRLSIDEFVTELHNIARLCKLGDLYDRMVLQALILGIESDRTRRRLFEKPNIALAEALDICRSVESANRDLKVIQEKSQEEAKVVRHGRRNTQGKGSSETASGACQRCATKHPPRSCPAYGKQCNRCLKPNHFAVCCTSKRQAREGAKPKTEKAHQASTDWNYSSDEEQSNVLSIKRQGRKLLVTLEVTARSTLRTIEFQLDTGATCNILTERDHKLMGCPELEETSTQLTLYDGSVCTPLGWCVLDVLNGKELCRLKFLVIKTAQHSLLSATTCLDLNLISLTETVNLVSDADLEVLLQEYEDVFQGLGCLPGEYNIEIDTAIKPVQVRPRKVPLTMKDDVLAELDRLEKLGVITKVDTPTEWISHMQPVRKPNGAVRICIDPQNLNKAIKRNHIPMPTLEDVLPQLNAARCFSLCDATSGFQQVKLAEESTELTTFWTPKGRYKYLRMPFGISSAPEEFQRRLADTLVGLEGVTVVADDILVFGQDRLEHDKHLRNLLERARRSGLKLNADKCKFLQDELSYIGHVLTSEGLKPDPRKVEAILKMEPPTTTDGVRRFLGHVTYMSKFLPNLSAESEPLRQLVNKDFVWEEPQKEAFRKLKRMLVETDALQYFDVKVPVVIQTDASTAGIGAVLLQKGKPVTYVSRSLTTSERNYAPIELEALAIVFGMTKLDQYIFGHPDVTVQTDHQALEAIFKKPMHKATRRVQSFLLTLQRYSGFKICWRPGSEQLTADMLSRDAYMEDPGLEAVRPQVFEVTEKPMDLPLPMPDYRLLWKATEEDPELQRLIEWIQSDSETLSPSLKSYKSFRDELTVERGLVFKGLRVVVPLSMQSEMLKKLHAAHLGLNATLRRARLTVYWPSLSEDIRKMLQTCQTCIKDSPKQAKEELRSHEIPVKVWTKVGVDLFEQARRHYVLIVDYTSDFMEFEELQNQTSDEVILAMKKTFARWGVPTVVHSDNGPQFTSQLFAEFAQSWGFEHSTSSPHYPQSNGKVEATIKVVKRILRRCDDPFLALLEYRNTTTEGTLSSPSLRLIGRSTRSILPQKILSPTLKEKENLREKECKMSKRQESYNKSARNLRPLRIGEPVWVRDYRQHHKEWKEARVTKQLSGRSYGVQVDDDLLRRNRRDLRPRDPNEAAEGDQAIGARSTDTPPIPVEGCEQDQAEHPVINTPAANIPLRRSTRTKRPPLWMADYDV